MKPTPLLVSLLALSLSGCNQYRRFSEDGETLKMLRSSIQRYGEQANSSCLPLALLTASGSFEPVTFSEQERIAYLRDRLQTLAAASASCDTILPASLFPASGATEGVSPRPIQQPKPGDAWNDFELKAADKHALASVRLSNLMLTGVSRSRVAGIRPLESRTRDTLTASLLRGLRHGGVTLEAGTPAVHGAVYAIGNPKAPRRVFGFANSLPAYGDQFADTFDMYVESAFASSSVSVAQQVRRDFARQKQARSTGVLRDVRLGGVQLEKSLPMADFFQAAIQEQTLYEGVRYGNGTTLTGWLKPTFDDDNEIVGVDGTIFGRLGGLLTAYAIPIDVSCKGYAYCGEVVGNLVTLEIDSQKETLYLGSGFPSTLK